MSHKYYAVKQGLTPNVIYTDWETTKKQITNFKGAVYKSFKTREEAEMYLENKNVIKVIDHINVLVYTDGSCIDNIGGYGVCIIQNPMVDVTLNTCQTYHGKVPYTPCTNNIAELYAIYIALKQLKKHDKILIKSDSKYSIDALTKYITNWKRNGFMTAKKEPVKNKALLLEIDALLTTFTCIQFEHVYGHNNEYYNEQVDKLANQGRACE